MAPGPSRPLPPAVLHALTGGAMVSYFQPIVDLTSGRIQGVEALARLHTPEGITGCGPLFQHAAASAAFDLEIECLRRHLQAASATVVDQLLFLNISPAALVEGSALAQLRLLAREAGLSPERIVVEVTECAESRDEDGLLRACQTLRAGGFQLAIDDVGAGASGLNRIMALRPDWLKLDREVAAGAHRDAFRQSMLDAFLTFARLSGVRLIVEGIETDAELDTVIRLGARYGQGYALGHPAPPPPALGEDVAARIRSSSEIARRRRRRTPDSAVAGGAARPIVTCPGDATLGQARQALAASPEAIGVVYVDGPRPVGWAARQSVLEHAASPGAPAVRSAQSLEAGVDPVDPGAPLLDLLAHCAVRADLESFPPVIVQSEAGVVGALPLRDVMTDARGVLQTMSEQRAPLTGLLTRAECDRRLAEALLAGEPLTATFIDIAGFHAINERLGYDVGDVVLRLLGGLVGQAGHPERAARFSGHLRDDRFLLVHELQGLEDALERLIGDFESSAAGYLDHLVDSGAEDGSLGLRLVRLDLPPGVFPTPHAVFDHAERVRTVAGAPVGERSRLIACDTQRRASA